MVVPATGGVLGVLCPWWGPVPVWHLAPVVSGHRGRYLKLGVLVKLSVAQWAQVDTDTDTMAPATRHTTLALLLTIIIAFVSTLSEARDLTVVTVWWISITHLKLTCEGKWHFILCSSFLFLHSVFPFKCLISFMSNFVRVSLPNTRPGVL